MMLWEQTFFGFLEALGLSFDATKGVFEVSVERFVVVHAFWSPL